MWGFGRLAPFLWCRRLSIEESWLAPWNSYVFPIWNEGSWSKAYGQALAWHWALGLGLGLGITCRSSSHSLFSVSTCKAVRLGSASVIAIEYDGWMSGRGLFRVSELDFLLCGNKANLKLLIRVSQPNPLSSCHMMACLLRQRTKHRVF